MASLRAILTYLNIIIMHWGDYYYYLRFIEEESEVGEYEVTCQRLNFFKYGYHLYSYKPQFILLHKEV
jgi:hypothetical protein